MNKSLLTNLLALALLVSGYLLDNETVKTVGIFALSGAITNWLAVHMLFEKVPGLYGSGVIPLHFDEFRRGIRDLMMEQFFTEENIERFVTERASSAIDFSSTIDNLDFDPTFDALLDTIEQSPFGGMLSMIGGREGLKGLKEPFIEKMKSALHNIATGDKVKNTIREQMSAVNGQARIAQQIGDIIDRRLAELTPESVKEIIQQMIKKHLGWLVIWGGVFGGLIGLVFSLI